MKSYCSYLNEIFNIRNYLHWHHIPYNHHFLIWCVVFVALIVVVVFVYVGVIVVIVMAVSVYAAIFSVSISVYVDVSISISISIDVVYVGVLVVVVVVVDVVYLVGVVYLVVVVVVEVTTSVVVVSCGSGANSSWYGNCYYRNSSVNIGFTVITVHIVNFVSITAANVAKSVIILISVIIKLHCFILAGQNATPRE